MIEIFPCQTPVNRKCVITRCRLWLIHLIVPLRITSILLKVFTLAASARIFACYATAQGVIANDAIIHPSNFDSTQELTLINSINPSQGRPGLFAISISPLGESEFMFSYSGIAEIYALYQVAPETAIDPSFATETTPLVSNHFLDRSSSIETFSIGQSRLYAYWDDGPLYHEGNILDTPDSTDLYGWVLITRAGTADLEVSSSATALGEGIIAGTFTQIPEPSTILLWILGFSIFVCRINRNFMPLNQTRPKSTEQGFE